jgi:hypothetical protein
VRSAGPPSRLMDVMGSAAPVVVSRWMLARVWHHQFTKYRHLAAIATCPFQPGVM